MSIQSLKKLQVWVRAKDFGLKIYKQVVPLLPAEEKWNINQQLRRSSLSISANIAEGHGRFYYQDNVRFCYNARGSLEETLSHLIFSFEMEFIPAVLYNELQAEGEEIEKMLNGYIGFLKKSKQGANEPGASHTIREETEAYQTGTTEDSNNNTH